MAESTKAAAPPAFPLLTVFFRLLAAHRPAFRQERTFHRARGLALGWLLALGRHTVARVLAALGLVTVDGTTIARCSRTMPGTGWLRAPGTAPFRRGLARAQRFVDLCWLPRPSAAGYSRAVPLRWAPAFPPKAVPAADHPPRKEWEAGGAEVGWVRREL